MTMAFFPFVCYQLYTFVLANQVWGDTFAHIFLFLNYRNVSLFHSAGLDYHLLEIKHMFWTAKFMNKFTNPAKTKPKDQISKLKS